VTIRCCDAKFAIAFCRISSMDSSDLPPTAGVGFVHAIEALICFKSVKSKFCESI